MQHTLTIAIIVLLAAASSHCMADIHIITNSHAPVDQLSEKEARKLFLGRLQLFPGTSIEPKIFDLPQEHPFFEPFYLQVTGMPLQKLKRYRAYYLFSGRGKVPSEKESLEQLIKAVAETPNGIGYTNKPIDNDKIKVLFSIEQKNQTTQK